jgi:hypothetical protein
MKLLAKSPAGRYATARDFAADLQRWLRHEPILARPRSGAERFAAWCRRNPAVASLTFLLVAGAEVSGVVLVRANRDLNAAVVSMTEARQTSDERLRRSLAAEADAILMGDDFGAGTRALEIVRQLQAAGYPVQETRSLAVRALAKFSRPGDSHACGGFCIQYRQGGLQSGFPPVCGRPANNRGIPDWQYGPRFPAGGGQ